MKDVCCRLQRKSVRSSKCWCYLITRTKVKLFRKNIGNYGIRSTETSRSFGLQTGSNKAEMSLRLVLDLFIAPGHGNLAHMWRGLPFLHRLCLSAKRFPVFHDGGEIRWSLTRKCVFDTTNVDQRSSPSCESLEFSSAGSVFRVHNLCRVKCIAHTYQWVSRSLA